MNKNIMEGQLVTINVKNKRGNSFPRTPFIFASNKDLYHFCPGEAEAIQNRCYKYIFQSYQDLENCTKKFHPSIWKELIQKKN